MTACEQCGECCKYMSFRVQSMSEGDKLYLSYHKNCYVYEDKLIILAPCIHLKCKNDKYMCAIHNKDNYPETCRIAACLRKEVIGGLDELAFVKEAGERRRRDLVGYKNPNYPYYQRTQLKTHENRKN